jgi:hypothetical protein
VEKSNSVIAISRVESRVAAVVTIFVIVAGNHRRMKVNQRLHSVSSDVSSPKTERNDKHRQKTYVNLLLEGRKDKKMLQCHSYLQSVKKSTGKKPTRT